MDPQGMKRQQTAGRPWRAGMACMTKRFADRVAHVLLLAMATLIVIGTGGCYVHNRPLQMDLRPNVRIPPRTAILMYIDGVGNQMLDERMAAGDVPNIKHYIIDRGLRFRRTVTCMPSITYAATATMLTGLDPGRHGIVGNKWFDPHAMEYREYGHIKTYRTAQNDLRGVTIFELLHDQFTTSIQVATRRGVTREIDNWATSGISWYFGRYTDVDQLTAMRFDLIADLANRTGRWPTFILAYFPSCDEVAHRFGIGSPRYRDAIRNADDQIGRICRGLERANLLDRTLLVLTSDHGQAPIRDGDGFVDMARYLRGHYGLKATDEWNPDPDYINRYAFYDRYDVVVVPDAPRLLGLHLRRAGLYWYDRPEDVRRLELSTRNGRILAEQLATDLARMPCTRFVAVRAGEGAVLLVGRRGKALVRRLRENHAATADTRCEPEQEAFGYKVVEGDDPLNLPATDLSDGGEGDEPPEKVLSARQWLASTIDSDNPGTVPQIVSYLDSPRSGDIVVFAEPGYGFGPDRSGHGSTTPQEMRIPLVFVGPGVSHGVTDEPTPLPGVMPTIITWLGFGDRLAAAGRLDGQPLLKVDNVTSDSVTMKQQ
jgi:arylsulfatase A-like enzyme